MEPANLAFGVPAPSFSQRAKILRTCPFSDETVVGCRHYLAVSEHGDFPGAADCRFEQRLRVTEHVRRRLCQRRAPLAAPTTYDQL
jgi:hypothetical protein